MSVKPEKRLRKCRACFRPDSPICCVFYAFIENCTSDPLKIASDNIKVRAFALAFYLKLA